MTRVALFGGSFNPPHVAHQLVALYVLETQPIDELWFVPVWEHVFGKPLAPYEDRIAMCALAARALGPRAKVDRAEAELAQQPGFQGSRTVDLIEMLIATRPGLAPRLVIGSDILGETAKWHRWDQILITAPPIVIARPGFPVPADVVHGPVMPSISSTQIRDALHRRDRAELPSLLPASVLEYIDTRQLYR